MEQGLFTPWDPVVQGIVALAVGSVVVGVVSSSIRELAGGYWILGWAALLLTGALYLLADSGYPAVAWAAFLTDAVFAPLMLMGALELHGRTPARGWPLLVGLAAGFVRIGLDATGSSVAHAIHGVVVAPVFFAAAAFVTFRAPRSAALRVPIGILLASLVVFEVWDAWSDFAAGSNQVLWRTLIALCVPLAALQIASRLLALRAGLVSARAASDESERMRDLERARFDMLFDRSRELVAEMGPDTRILYVNGRIQGLLGLEREAVIGRRAIDFVSPELRDEAEEIWRHQLEPGDAGEPTILPLVDKDGRAIFLEVNVSDYDYAGERRLLVLARDVTERQHAEQQLEEHRRELEVRVRESTEKLRESLVRLRDQERLAAVGTLASGIAHQINNPVGAISAAAEFALLSGDDSDGRSIQREALSRIVEEAQRAGRIVKSVLRFARHGATAKWREDLGTVVRRSIELVRPYVREREGRIELDVAEIALPVMMSPIELEQMLVNLVRNAAESRRKGVRICVTTRAETGSAMLEVRDDGAGMTPDEKARVFDPFFTTRLREGGSGLGLSVVHGIVTDHGGEIEVASDIEKGTCVRIRFPICDDEDDDAGSGSEPPRSTPLRS